MNVTAYVHGWVGAGVAAALMADPDINPTFVLYPEAQFTDEHPCRVPLAIASHYPYPTYYVWPARGIPEDGIDAVITANWRHVLDAKRFEDAPLGGFNIHNSLLPNYKGRRPVQRSLEAGDKYMGYTIHRLTDAIDSGEIITQRGFYGLKDEELVYHTFGLFAGHDLLRVLKEQQRERHCRPTQ